MVRWFKISHLKLDELRSKIVWGAKRNREHDLSEWHSRFARYYPVEGDVYQGK